MIVAIEPICHNSEHVPVNTSVLEILKYAYPEESLHFYGEAHHVDQIRKMIRTDIESTITWETVSIPYRHAGFFQRLPDDFKIIHNMVQEIKPQGKNIKILLTAANPSMIWALKLLCPLKLRKYQIQIIMHGGLSGISGWRSQNPFIRIQDQLSAFSFFNWKNINYIVLEGFIKDRLLKSVPKLGGNVWTLAHPFPELQQHHNLLELKKPIRFGYLGVATERKGFTQFLKTAAIINKKLPAEAEFHAIGRIHGEYRGKDLPELRFLSTQPGTVQLSREDFIAKLKTMHFVCFFFDEQYYRYSASGVLLDAIAFEKPIIGSKLKIFQDLTHEFGDIGYLCESQSYTEAIHNIVKTRDSEKYRRQVENLLKLKNKRMPQTLASKYRRISDEINTRHQFQETLT